MAGDAGTKFAVGQTFKLGDFVVTVDRILPPNEVILSTIVIPKRAFMRATASGFEATAVAQKP